MSVAEDCRAVLEDAGSAFDQIAELLNLTAGTFDTHETDALQGIARLSRMMAERVDAFLEPRPGGVS